MLAPLILLACHTPKPLDAALAATGDAKRGEIQYQIVCAGCHGPSGRGVSRTPGLQRAATSFTDAELTDAMLNGRGAMRRVPIDDQTAADIRAHLRARFAAP